MYNMRGTSYYLLAFSKRKKRKKKLATMYVAKQNLDITFQFSFAFFFLFFVDTFKYQFLTFELQGTKNIIQAQRARIDIEAEPIVKATKEAFFKRGSEFISLL